MNVVRGEESIQFSLTGVDETFGLRGNQQQPVCDPLLPGVDVGGATLLRRIASGGMGVVFEAHQHAPSRRVAVKFLNGCGGTFAHRLLAEEAALLARVKHSHIADVYTVGSYEKCGHSYQWVMMELVENACSLTDYALNRNLSLVDRVGLALNAVSAITAAHAKGIIHLDIKPANVLVSNDGRVKVIDFGIARALTGNDTLQGNDAGKVMGTPAFMSPEQRAGHDELIDARSDVYGMGMLFVELFFSQADRNGSGRDDLYENVCKEWGSQSINYHQISRGAVKDLCAVVTRCTQQRPENRFSTMWEVEQELSRWLNGQPVVCRQVTAVEFVGRWIIRNKLVSCFLSVFVVIVLSALVAIGWFAHTSSLARQEAVIAAGVARGTLADSLLRQAFSAEREHHPQMVHELLSQREEVLSYFSDQLPARVLRNDSLAIRTLRSRLDDASAFWQMPGTSITAVAVAELAGVAVATSKDGGVGLYLLGSGRVNWIQTFHYETGSRPWAVAISETGRLAVVGCSDGLIHVLDTEEGKAIGVYSGHDGPVYGLVMSSSSEEFLSCGRDGHLRQWNVHEPQQATILTTFSTSVYGLDQSPDGQWIAAGLRDGSVRLWHKRSGRNELLVGHQGRIFGVDFSDDGKHLVSASEDKTVRVWDLDQLTQSACFQHPVRVNAVRFCGAGRVASAAGDQILRLWALHGEKELRKLVGHEGTIWSLDVAGTTGLFTGSGDGTVRLWEDAWDPQPKCVTGSKIHTVSRSADGRYLAVGTSAGEVTIWDPLTRSLIAKKKVSHQPINDIRWHPVLPELSVAGSDSTVTQWAFERGQSTPCIDAVGQYEPSLHHMNTLSGHRRRVFSIAYSLSGALLASAGEDRTVRLWHRNELQSATTIHHPGRVFCLAFLTSGGTEYLASGCEDGAVRIFNRQGELIEMFRGHRGQVNALVWNNSAECHWDIASAGADGTVRLWNLSKESGKRQPPYLTPCGVLTAGGAKIWSLASVPDEKLIIGGTERGEVVLWSTSESVPLGMFRGDDEPVWSVSVGPNGDQLWSGGWDGVVRRWDIRRTRACTNENAYVFTNNSGIN